MARRLLDAAQLAAWLDLEDNISDDEDIVESKDSEDEIDQRSPEERDDVTWRVWMIHLLLTAKMYWQV